MNPDRCVNCGGSFPSERASGRPRQYCPRRPCKLAMKRKHMRAYLTRKRNGLILAQGDPLPREPEKPARPVEWWLTQARQVRGECPCGAPMEGVYVAPTQETMNECAVVAHCRICGRERMVIAGRAGVPYEFT